MLRIISGEINSGKTRYVYRYVHEKIKQGAILNGWLLVPFIKANKKAGHNYLEIINSNVKKPVIYSRNHNLTDSIRIGKFHVKKTIFEKALLIPRKGLFVLDEIGYYEIEKNKGFINIVDKILDETNDQLFIVQKRVLDKFMDFYSKHEPKLIYI